MHVTYHRQPEVVAGLAIDGEAKGQLIELPADETDLRAMTLELAAGARTAWHTHPLGQLLIAVRGTGLLQAGDRLVRLREGDAVWTPPGQSHWHGATADDEFVYTSIQPADPTTGEHVHWDRPVTEAEYLAEPEHATLA